MPQTAVTSMLVEASPPEGSLSADGEGNSAGAVWALLTKKSAIADNEG